MAREREKDLVFEHGRRIDVVPARPETTALATLDPQGLIAKALESNAGIDTLERLFTLAKDMRAWQAREVFYRQKALFHARCPVIPKGRTARIQTRTGPGFEYDYAGLSDILKLTMPLLSELGFSVRWNAKLENHAVVVTCFLSHEAGHMEDSGPLVMPVAGGPDDGRGATPQQRVGSSMSYGRRYSFCAVTGVVPEDDEDNDGGDIGDDTPPDAQGERHPTTAPPETARQTVMASLRKKVAALTTAERMDLGKRYLEGGTMAKSTVEQLQALEGFLGDDAAVAQWRAERAGNGGKA